MKKLVVFLTCIMIQGGASAKALEDWSFATYYGRTAQTIFLKLLRFKDPHFFDTRIVSVEADRKLKSFWENRFQFEWAFNLTRRLENDHQKDFWEFNTFIIARWMKFPWNKYVYTTVAFGDGLSYAGRVPHIEVHDETNSERTSRYLNFLSFEITLARPTCPDWSILYRLHHRSGIFGLVNNVSGGSNVVALGIKYTYMPNCSTF